MAKELYGHIPTRTSSAIMRHLLEDKTHYDVLGSYAIKLSRSLSWQKNYYENKLSVTPDFFGEPEINTDRVNAHTYTVKVGPWTIQWWFNYHFKGRRYNTKGTINEGNSGYGTNINMDRLYYILVNRFNFGEDFIRVFLNEVVPSLMRTEIHRILDPVMLKVGELVVNNMLRFTKTGDLDKRYRATKNLNLEVNRLFNTAAWQHKSDELEDTLKELFKQSMRTGTVGGHQFIRHENADTTKRKKLYYYDSIMSEFVGSGQFIDAIVFDLNMRIY